MRRLLALTVTAGLAGCAVQPAAPVAAPEAVSLHESPASAPPRYEIVRRLWVESWRSAFMVPTYASADEGMADLRREAARLGGNGILNFDCYPLRGNRLVCNGTVVKFP